MQKKKENLWQLLERLDEEAGQFNQSIAEANRIFNAATAKTKKILDKQEKQLHATISKVKRALKKFAAKK